jgi:hypothetical protein
VGCHGSIHDLTSRARADVAPWSSRGGDFHRLCIQERLCDGQQNVSAQVENPSDDSDVAILYAGHCPQRGGTDPLNTSTSAGDRGRGRATEPLALAFMARARTIGPEKVSGEGSRRNPHSLNSSQSPAERCQDLWRGRRPLGLFKHPAPGVSAIESTPQFSVMDATRPRLAR